MHLYKNNIPSKLIVCKQSHVVPEEIITQSFNIYKDAIPYILCELKSTIQHEAAHRYDEEHRTEDIIKHKQGPMVSAQVIPFSSFVNPSRAEPIAERDEDDCSSLLPEQVSGETEMVTLSQLFEQAKSAANVNPEYKQDIHAGRLPPEAQGMYLMQDLSGLSQEQLIQVKERRGNAYVDYDNRIWVDVHKIVSPFLSESKQENLRPSTYQGPGDGAVQADLPGVSAQPPSGVNAVPAASGLPSIPGVPGRGSV